MPETTFEIAVSHREIDRSRLIECAAIDREGRPLPGLVLLLQIEANGTFDVDAELTTKELVTGAGGIAYVTWWEYPRSGPRRDFVSKIRVSWEDEAASIWLDNMYE